MITCPEVGGAHTVSHYLGCTHAWVSQRPHTYTYSIATPTTIHWMPVYIHSYFTVVWNHGYFKGAHPLNPVSIVCSSMGSSGKN